MTQTVLKFLFIFALLSSIFHFLSSTISYSLESPRFRIQEEKIQIDIQKSSADISTIAQTWDEETYRIFLEKGYAVKNYSTFGSSISQALVKFKSSPKQKVFTDSIKVEVFPSQLAYEVRILQEYPLRGNQNKKIQVEYSLSGDDIANDFTSKNLYRPFTNRQTKTIMSALPSGNKREAEVKLKVNIPQFTPVGTYETVINFVAIPGY